ncbi:MAG: hypothetical protein ACUVQ0_06425 [Thermoproteota archaeon]
MNYREVIRKSIHLILTVILLSPFILRFFKIEVNASAFYSVLSIAALTLNAIQIKRPLLRSEMKRFVRERREKFLEDMKNFLPLKSQVTSQVLNRIEEKIRGFEDFIDEQLLIVERDYEKRGGHIGLTYGIIGVTISYFLFGEYSFYGIVSLATTDFVSTLVGGLKGTHRLPLINKTIEGTISGFTIFLTILLLLGKASHISMLLSVVAAFIEAYAIEDNLFLPVTVSFLSSILL